MESQSTGSTTPSPVRGELYRKVGPNEQIELSGLNVGDTITISVLPAKRNSGAGGSRGKRVTAAIVAPKNVKILTARQRPKTKSVDTPPPSGQ